MLSVDNPFYRQVVLLVELLPLVVGEPYDISQHWAYLTAPGIFHTAGDISPSILVRDSRPIDRIREGIEPPTRGFSVR
jgi:hypothetical protein